MLLGVDVGGTFTDAVLFDGERLHTAKLPTTPEDQSRAVIAAVEAVIERAGAGATEVEAFAHGMTVGTNALLEERGARTALIATRGFGDVLEIARQDRPHLYRLCAPKPTPLVEEELRFEAAERTGPEGVIEPLAATEPARLAELLRDSGAEAVAICLLFSYLDPTHEQRLAEHLRRELPDVHVSASHEVLPRFREYERCSTTAIDAYLSPLLGRYLGRLGAAAGDAGLPQPLVMQSSGGVASAEEAARAGAWSVLSGPGGRRRRRRPARPALRRRQRAGLRHGRDLLRRLRGRGRRGEADRLAHDRRPRDPAADGRRPHRRRRRRLDRLARQRWRPARWPALGRRPAGARLLRARRQEPTVTDANLLLGRLAADSRLAGDISLDASAAADASATLAASLGLAELETAEGIVRIANQEMVRALRVVTVERGIDPRRFALLPFGGAGPMHAAAIAAELEIDRILCPRGGGVLSALGLCASDRRQDTARTVMLSGDELSAEQVAAEVEELIAGLASGAEARARSRLRDALRRPGLRLPVSGSTRPDPADLAERFAAAHEQLYGHRDPEADVVLVHIRLAMVAPEHAPAPRAAAGQVERGVAAGPLRRRVAGDPHPARRAPARALRSRARSIFELPEATFVLPPGWRAEVDDAGTIEPKPCNALRPSHERSGGGDGSGRRCR